jgi:hypothetical protein
MIMLLAIPFLRTPSWADTLTHVSDPSQQSANDSISWSNLGGDGTLLNSSSFNVNSTHSIGVSGTLAGANSLTAVVRPAAGRACPAGLPRATNCFGPRMPLMAATAP